MTNQELYDKLTDKLLTKTTPWNWVDLEDSCLPYKRKYEIAKDFIRHLQKLFDSMVVK